METALHLQLKSLAADLLLSVGCAAVATEVACPISRYRIDAAGYLDRLPARRRRPSLTWLERGEGAGFAVERLPKARTIFIECKASRADFLRDGRELPRLLSQRERMGARLAEVERSVVREQEPHLRRSGSFLFAEMEEWDYAASRLVAHRALVRCLRRLDAQIYSETKFFMVSRYRLGDLFYLLTPAGLVQRRELPLGWGLIEMGGRSAGGCPAVRVRREAEPHFPKEEYLAGALRNIAAAATRDSVGRAREGGFGSAAPGTARARL